MIFPLAGSQITILHDCVEESTPATKGLLSLTVLANQVSHCVMVELDVVVFTGSLRISVEILVGATVSKEVIDRLARIQGGLGEFVDRVLFHEILGDGIRAEFARLLSQTQVHVHIGPS